MNIHIIKLSRTHEAYKVYMTLYDQMRDRLFPITMKKTGDLTLKLPQMSQWTDDWLPSCQSLELGENINDVRTTGDPLIASFLLSYTSASWLI